MTIPHFWTPTEAATFMHHSVATLANWRCLGKGPRWVKLPSGRVRYRLSEVIQWMESRP